MKTTTIPPIQKRLLVNASPERAFEVFTQEMDLWWPRTHHIGATPMTAMILEPRLHGRWYTTHEDGSECITGHVLVWEPPRRLVLAWQIDANFEYVPSLITEVEVTFTTDGAGGTIVAFEHRDLDRLGEGKKEVGNMDAGWGMILDRYAEIAQGAAQ